MTKVELALILQIIDTHTIKRSYNYGAPDTIEIDDVDKLKQHTRNYAKRQLTWFRKNPALNITI